ncbi:MAG: hypothetical protein P4L84_23115 [Isosphaeraceae bacterium]|nr:hypothetical protein [Isosphaeraceae bacterium]
MSRLKLGLTAVGLAVLLAPSANAQAVAFQPVVGSFPDGAMMSATPVVSADRRYVRISVNPQFTALNGFDNFQVPGAVSGGPGGALPGGLAGLNGPMGGAGQAARSAAPVAAAASAVGGRSASDPFQNALASYSAGPQLGEPSEPQPRDAKAAVPKKGSRRREIIRRRP